MSVAGAHRFLAHAWGEELTRRAPCLLWGTRMRRVPKHAWLIVRAPVLVGTVRSCGTTRSGPTTTPATSAPMAAVTLTTASTFTVPTAPATVNGKPVTILTDGQGRTLYSFTPDAVSKTLCTGSCAQTWPPAALHRNRQAHGLHGTTGGMRSVQACQWRAGHLK